MAVADDPVPFLPPFQPSESAFHGVETRLTPTTDIWGIRARAKLSITPSGDVPWTLRIITILLNGLDQTWSRGETARLASTWSRNSNPRIYLRFLFQCEDTELDRRLEVRVFLGDWTIEVDASREWIVIEWESRTRMIHSADGTHSRKIKTARDREYVQYLWEVKPTKEATKSIIERLALLYYERKELSGSLKYFVRVLVRNGVPQTRNFRLMHEIHTAIALKKKAKDITRQEEFQSTTLGYLQLTVYAWQQQDHGHFEATTWEMVRCSILKGCYVTPFTCSLFRDHAKLVSGLLMGITWRIIRLYVASILKVVIGNVGIPVALSFGPTEDAA